MLLVWLRHSYNIDKHGPPTWRRLVEAVDNDAGGNNRALAKKIASNHEKIASNHPAGTLYYNNYD